MVHLKMQTSEVSAVVDSADYGYLIESMVKELYALEDLPIIKVYTDSKSLKKHLEITRIIADLCCQVDTAHLRETVALREIECMTTGRLHDLKRCCIRTTVNGVG